MQGPSNHNRGGYDPLILQLAQQLGVPPSQVRIPQPFGTNNHYQQGPHQQHLPFPAINRASAGLAKKKKHHGINAYAPAAHAANPAVLLGQDAGNSSHQDEEDAGLGDGLDEGCFAAVSTAELEKLGLKPHPDKIAEALSLASIPTSTDNKYRMSLPGHVLSNGISALQFQAVHMACAKHETFLKDGYRAGFFLGDAPNAYAGKGYQTFVSTIELGRSSAAKPLLSAKRSSPGVGKGRQVAACILENLCKGRRKAIWFSVSGDLALDARRDLMDIGAMQYVRLHDLKKLKAKPGQKLSELPGMDMGILFATYDLLISGTATRKKKKDTPQATPVRSASGNGEDPGMEGVPPQIAEDDDGLVDEFGEGSRLQQIVDWFGVDFDGLIVFDECHRAKNCVPKQDEKGRVKGAETKTSRAVVELQKRLKHARILYVSATGATESENLCYMERLGLWGPGTAFGSKGNFVEMLRSKGVGAMELVAMELKQNGCYMARTLSYDGVRFEQHPVDIDQHFKALYDTAAKLWQEVKVNLVQAKEKGLIVPKEFKTVMGQYWGAHLRFFRQLCTAAKVATVEKIAKAELEKGHCVVIGLQTTGEARTAAFVDSIGGEDAELDSFVEPASQILATLLRNVMPPAWPARAGLIQQAEGLKLPPNPLDTLIHNLGGPSAVAEMTGRSKRITHVDGVLKYISRAPPDVPLDMVNIKEKEAFQAGEKLVAIISDAASTGISLQADNNKPNTRLRVHITLELAWSADKTVQQLGRTHRSNQKQPPLYMLVSTDISGEHRFASAVARRLEQLGALTQGDRHAASAADALSGSNLQNKYGANALRRMYKIISREFPIPEHVIPQWLQEQLQDLGTSNALVKRRAQTERMQEFLDDSLIALESVGIDASTKVEITEEENADGGGKKQRRKGPGGDISKLLNRILGLEVERQKKIFHYFMALLEAEIAEAKRTGQFNEYGIIKPSCEDITLKHKEAVYVNSNTGMETVHYEFQLDRGCTWEKAVERLKAEREGDPENQSCFCYSEGGFGNRNFALAIERNERGRKMSRNGKTRTAGYFRIIRPGTGFSHTDMSAQELREKFTIVARGDEDKAWVARGWKDMYNSEYGRKLRQQHCHILAGSILPILPTLHNLFSHVRIRGKLVPLQVMRVQTTDGKLSVIGVHVPHEMAAELLTKVKALPDNPMMLNMKKSRTLLESAGSGAAPPALAWPAAPAAPAAQAPRPDVAVVEIDQEGDADADEAGDPAAGPAVANPSPFAAAAQHNVSDGENIDDEDDDVIDLNDDHDDDDDAPRARARARRRPGVRRRSASLNKRDSGQGAGAAEKAKDFVDLSDDFKQNLAAAGLWSDESAHLQLLAEAKLSTATPAAHASATAHKRGRPPKPSPSPLDTSASGLASALATPATGATNSGSEDLDIDDPALDAMINAQPPATAAPSIRKLKIKLRLPTPAAQRTPELAKSASADVDDEHAAGTAAAPGRNSCGANSDPANSKRSRSGREIKKPASHTECITIEDSEEEACIDAEQEAAESDDPDYDDGYADGALNEDDQNAEQGNQTDQNADVDSHGDLHADDAAASYGAEDQDAELDKYLQMHDPDADKADAGMAEADAADCHAAGKKHAAHGKPKKHAAKQLKSSAHAPGNADVLDSGEAQAAKQNDSKTTGSKRHSIHDVKPHSRFADLNKLVKQQRQGDKAASMSDDDLERGRKKDKEHRHSKKHKKNQNSGDDIDADTKLKKHQRLDGNHTYHDSDGEAVDAKDKKRSDSSNKPKKQHHMHDSDTDSSRSRSRSRSHSRARKHRNSSKHRSRKSEKHSSKKSEKHDASKHRDKHDQKRHSRSHHGKNESDAEIADDHAGTEADLSEHEGAEHAVALHAAAAAAAKTSPVISAAAASTSPASGSDLGKRKPEVLAAGHKCGVAEHVEHQQRSDSKRLRTSGPSPVPGSRTNSATAAPIRTRAVIMDSSDDEDEIPLARVRPSPAAATTPTEAAGLAAGTGSKTLDATASQLATAAAVPAAATPAGAAAAAVRAAVSTPAASASGSAAAATAPRPAAIVAAVTSSTPDIAANAHRIAQREFIPTVQPINPVAAQAANDATHEVPASVLQAIENRVRAEEQKKVQADLLEKLKKASEIGKKKAEAAAAQQLQSLQTELAQARALLEGERAASRRAQQLAQQQQQQDASNTAAAEMGRLKEEAAQARLKAEREVRERQQLEEERQKLLRMQAKLLAELAAAKRAAAPRTQTEVMLPTSDAMGGTVNADIVSASTTAAGSVADHVSRGGAAAPTAASHVNADAKPDVAAVPTSTADEAAPPAAHNAGLPTKLSPSQPTAQVTASGAEQQALTPSAAKPPPATPVSSAASTPADAPGLAKVQPSHSLSPSPLPKRHLATPHTTTRTPLSDKVNIGSPVSQLISRTVTKALEGDDVEDTVPVDKRRRSWAPSPPSLEVLHILMDEDDMGGEAQAGDALAHNQHTEVQPEAHGAVNADGETQIGSISDHVKHQQAASKEPQGSATAGMDNHASAGDEHLGTASRQLTENDRQDGAINCMIAVSDTSEQQQETIDNADAHHDINEATTHASSAEVAGSATHQQPLTQHQAAGQGVDICMGIIVASKKTTTVSEPKPADVHISPPKQTLSPLPPPPSMHHDASAHRSPQTGTSPLPRRKRPSLDPDCLIPSTVKMGSPSAAQLSEGVTPQGSPATGPISLLTPPSSPTQASQPSQAAKEANQAARHGRQDNSNSQFAFMQAMAAAVVKSPRATSTETLGSESQTHGDGGDVADIEEGQVAIAAPVMTSFEKDDVHTFLSQHAEGLTGKALRARFAGSCQVAGEKLRECLAELVSDMDVVRKGAQSQDFQEIALDCDKVVYLAF